MINLLALEDLGDGRFRAPHGDIAVGANVFGGQILAQLAYAAQQTLGDVPLTSMHAVFPRPALVAAPLYIDVATIRRGRNATMLQATLHQGEEPCVTALCTGIVAQVDVEAQHAVSYTDCPPPDAAKAMSPGPMGLEVRVVDGDLDDPKGNHPASIDLWIRVPVAGAADPASLRALIAFAGEIWFAGTALRPVEGRSQANLMSELIPAVLSHTLAFHTVSPAIGEWLLFRVESPVLRAGRVYGQAMVFDQAGALLASIGQENLLRTPRPSGR